MDYETPVKLYEEVRDVLQDKLDYSNIDNLKKQLSDTSAIQYDVSSKKREIYILLVGEKERARMPRSDGLTDLDRTVILNASVKDIEGDYLFLEKIEVLLDRRIELGINFIQIS